MTTKLALKTTILLAALAACLPAANATTDTADRQQITTAMRRAFDWQIANPTTAKYPVDNSQGPRGWVHGAFLTGVMEAARTTADTAYLDYAWKTATDNSWQLGPRFEHGDDHIIGQTYLELHELDPARANITRVTDTFDRLLAQHHDGAKLLWWCDSLYMHPQVWARLAKTTGDKKYLDEMDRLYWASVDYLYDKDEHLFFRDKNYMPHDKDFKPTRAKKGATQRFIEANGKKMFWSRGNGWVFAGLPRIMNYIPAGDPRRAKYETLFRQMAARIAALQSPDGLWRMGLLDPAAYGPGEESGSAFFVYALAWGLRTGLLDPATYRPAIDRGWRALLACQQPDGMIGFVQPIGAAPGEHSAKTFQEYGTGGFLLAASEMYKLADPAPNTLTPGEKAAGWRLLWDGKTTAGWRSAKSDDFPAKGWIIKKDGTLNVIANNGEESAAGGDIITRARYTDFELRLDFKITPGANSGVKYFVQPNLDPITGAGAKAAVGSAIGLEYQILDDALHPDAKLGRDGNRTLGSLYDLIPAAPGKKPNPVGEWNTARIIVRGNHVEHWLNGEKILEYERGSPACRDAVARSKYKNIPNFGEWPDGHILLQEHGNEVSFRNIKILVLAPAK